MAIRIFDTHIRDSLNERLKKLENQFSSDIVSVYGPIIPPIEKIFRDFIEKLKSEFADKQRVAIFLTTTGGVAETVEKLVDIIRFHYDEVYFVVPDYATIMIFWWSLSNDRTTRSFFTARTTFREIRQCPREKISEIYWILKEKWRKNDLI
jgi:ATP-dependent protease ClpP protease subunit